MEIDEKEVWHEVPCRALAGDVDVNAWRFGGFEPA